MALLDFSTIFRDIHPLTTHFPIALLVASVFLDVVSRFRSQDEGLKRAAYVTLLLGALAAIVTVITGNIALFRLGGENTPAGQLASTHEEIATFSTLAFAGAAFWQYNSHRRGVEIKRQGLFLALEIIGVVGLVLTGLAGGNLVYTYGLGVQGAPLP